ncbi:MAG: redox-regulated ATPase YchF [Deltaproteobacteria bacterium]|nr:MAG: redox-regulated ATPase YchF [Deltaproteobacteria bacterium]
MKIGIIGLPQSGKLTLFQALTGIERAEHSSQQKTLLGTADILDPRFDALVSRYQPKKDVPAKIDFQLLPTLEKEAIAKGDIFRDIADMDAICHVIRAFEDASVFHVNGSVDPIRDMDTINAELLLHDLVFVEKRLERIAAALKKIKDEKQQKEQALLERMKAHLETELPLRMMDITEDEDSLIRSYPLITRKKMVLAINISEDAVTTIEDGYAAIQARCAELDMQSMRVSAQVESEIVTLDDPEERLAFLADMGITEPALGVLTRLCLAALGRISFFTVGKDEVRQWLVRKNATAPEAAGVIHSDLQRGFIRAETMKYDELMAYPDEAALKKAGKMYLQGKEYRVEDGDILNIRFKV